MILKPVWPPSEGEAHTGFNVHSRVRTPTKAEAGRVGYYGSPQGGGEDYRGLIGAIVDAAGRRYGL